jgi:hypothetical protein
MMTVATNGSVLQHRYIDPIKLLLAADDFSNALKEVKKLK